MMSSQDAVITHLRLFIYRVIREIINLLKEFVQFNYFLCEKDKRILPADDGDFTTFLLRHFTIGLPCSDAPRLPGTLPHHNHKLVA